MPRERMVALLQEDRQREEDWEEKARWSRERRQKERRKELARGAKAPEVSREKGTRRREAEVGKEEYLEILRASARLAEPREVGARERYDGEEG